MTDDTPTPTWRESLAQGRAGEALAHYRLSEVPSGDTYDALKTLADLQEALREKGYLRAVEKLNRLETKPDLTDWDTLTRDLEVLKNAAESLDKRRDPEAALSLLEPLNLPLLNAEADTLRGTANVLMNETEAATRHFEHAISLDPKHYRAITNLGNLALEAGRTDEAIAAYERSLKLNEAFPNAHHNLGVAYRRKGQINRSVRHLRKAQNANQRQMREEARTTLRSGAGQSWRKYGRWLVYAVIAVAAFLVLRSQGML